MRKGVWQSTVSEITGCGVVGKEREDGEVQ